VEQGWVGRADLEDLLAGMDGRLRDLPVDDLAELLGFPSRDTCHKPRFATSDVVWFARHEVRDIAGFVITLEQLGFAVDPGPMVATFADQVNSVSMMTLAELAIHTYSTQQARQRRELWCDTAPAGESTQRNWRGAGGYRNRATMRGDYVTALTVTGPKYRARRQRDVVCAICKESYTQGDKESGLHHRSEHARVVRLLQPRSLKAMRERLAQGRAAAERVDEHAPLWLHNEVTARATRFRRDFGYTSSQWHEAKRREEIDPKWRGFVFVDDAGAIDGACVFAKEPEGWTLCWVWIRPGRRHHGLLAARWPAYLEEFGHFWIEHPLSETMTRFVARHASPEQRQRIAERYPDGHELAQPTARAV